MQFIGTSALWETKYRSLHAFSFYFCAVHDILQLLSLTHSSLYLSVLSPRACWFCFFDSPTAAAFAFSFCSLSFDILIWYMFSCCLVYFLFSPCLAPSTLRFLSSPLPPATTVLGSTFCWHLHRVVGSVLLTCWSCGRGCRRAWYPLAITQLQLQHEQRKTSKSRHTLRFFIYLLFCPRRQTKTYQRQIRHQQPSAIGHLHAYCLSSPIKRRSFGHGVKT